MYADRSYHIENRARSLSKIKSQTYKAMINKQVKILFRGLSADNIYQMQKQLENTEKYNDIDGNIFMPSGTKTGVDDNDNVITVRQHVNTNPANSPYLSFESPSFAISAGKYSLKPVAPNGIPIGLYKSAQGIKSIKSYENKVKKIFNVHNGFRNVGYVGIVPLAKEDYEEMTKNGNLIWLNTVQNIIQTYIKEDIEYNAKDFKSVVTRELADDEVLTKLPLNVTPTRTQSYHWKNEKIGIMKVVQIDNDEYIKFNNIKGVGVNWYKNTEGAHICYAYILLNDTAKGIIDTDKKEKLDDDRDCEKGLKDKLNVDLAEVEEIMGQRYEGTEQFIVDKIQIPETPYYDGFEENLTEITTKEDIRSLAMQIDAEDKYEKKQKTRAGRPKEDFRNPVVHIKVLDKDGEATEYQFGKIEKLHY